MVDGIKANDCLLLKQHYTLYSPFTKYSSVYTTILHIEQKKHYY